MADAENVHEITADLVRGRQNGIDGERALRDGTPVGRRNQRKLQGSRLGEFELLALKFPMRQIARSLQFAVSRNQGPVGGLELSVERRLSFLEQRHLMGFLLHAACGVAVRCHVEQQHPRLVPKEANRHA